MRKLTALGIGAVLLCTSLALADGVSSVQAAKSSNEAAAIQSQIPTADAAVVSNMTKPENPAELEGEQVIKKEKPATIFQVTSTVETRGGLVCPGDSLFAQDADGGNAANIDQDLGYTGFEWVSPNGDVQTVTWWGIHYYFDGAAWNPCSPPHKDPDDYEIAFWADDGSGLPDLTAPVYGPWTVSPTRTDTGVAFASTTIQEYFVTLPATVNVTSLWISIQGLNAGQQCYSLWVSSNDDVGSCQQWDGTAWVTPTPTYDLSVCLGGVYIPTYGACCIDSIPQCTNGVEALECAAQGGRFAANTDCLLLDPACGTILGACCLDGVCVETCTESVCLTTHMGIWFEGEDCATFTCPPANDSCETAMPIGDVTDLAFDTTLATTSGLGAHTINQDVFYCYTATCDGIASIDLCGSGFDTKLAVWQDCACPPTVELAYNDDSGPACSGLQSSVEIAVTTGQRYLIQAGGYGSAAGIGDLTVYCYVPPTGACCNDSVCTTLSELACTTGGGLYMGDDVPCDPNPCLGLCCTMNVDTFPYSDDLEAGFGGWLNAVVGDEADWTWQSGATGSSNTGPSGDHTTGTGYYFYTETSGYNNMVFILDGPCFDFTTVPSACMVFYYHMYGDTMGTLELQASDDDCATWTTIWSLSGDQGDAWQMATVDLSAYTTVSLRFKGTSGTSYTSDMAIDDIWVGDCSVVTGACCNGTVCTEVEEVTCLAGGGFYIGDYTTCADVNPCSGACCDMFTCLGNYNEPDCLAMGGQWNLGEDCATYICSPYCDICFTETGDPDDWITNVRFGLIDNTTGPEGEPCSYGDYTNLSTPVAPGATYTLSVSIDSGTYTECITAFFDWNRDGVYDNVTERYDLGCIASDTLTMDITVPGDASYGIAGMRVIEKYSSAVTDPCTGATYGETEDYLIDIQPVAAACCLGDGSCVVLLPDDCAAQGGTYGGATAVCAGADCNSNGADDFCDILAGTSTDCDGNLIPDECEIAGNDCNMNGVLDICDVAAGTSLDCNANLIPDECELVGNDCNMNGIPDECDEDCNENGYPDECDIPIALGGYCDPMSGQFCSEDCNLNMIPDECELDAPAKAAVSFHISCRNDVSGLSVYIFDAAGVYTGVSYAQLSSSTWGYRDGAYDGDYVYFGDESNLYRHDAADGANGMILFANSTGQTLRALAYDPTGNFGLGSFWTADFGSSLLEIDMLGNVLNTYPVDGWSLYGLAYDDADGNLWAHTTDSAVIKIDTTTGLVIPGVGWASPIGAVTQGGLSGVSELGGMVAPVWQADPEDQFATVDYAGAIVAGPFNIQSQASADAQGLGIAVTGGSGGGDCNTNGIPDICDIPVELGGFCEENCSLDCNLDQIPDECQLDDNDCNMNGIPDDCDIAAGTSLDCQPDGIPDECQLVHNDCNMNGIPDDCDLAAGAPDCNNNGIPDACDIPIALGGYCDPGVQDCSEDCQGDGIPDECQLATIPGRAIILDEGFETSVPPTGWDFVATHTGQMTWFQSTATFYEGAASAQCDYDPALVPQDEWLLSPSMMLFGDVTFSGATQGSYYWGVTPFNNYDIEAWAVFGPTPDVNTDMLIATIDDDNWLVNWTWETFSYTFAAPAVPFRLGLRYVGSDGAQGNLDALVIDGETGAPANDCNMNGVPDECDLPPICNDPWPACAMDVNENGLIDACEPACPGDSNCDGVISWRDIDFFVAAMNDNVDSWVAMFGAAPACTFYNNDVNEDGTVSWRDIDPLVAVMNTTCP